MNLRVVPDEPNEPLAHEQANAEFKQHWTGAREAYAELLSAVGNLTHPLYTQGGVVGRARIDAAQYAADRIVKHALQTAAEIATCRDIWDRAALNRQEQ